MWDTAYDEYFKWDSVARTATRITNLASAANIPAATAEDAIALVTGSVARPTDEVKAVVGADDYAAYFKKVAASNGDGTWNVSSVLDEGVVLDDETDVLTAVLDDAMDSDAVAITIPAKNGLYYSLKSGAEVTGRTEGTRVLATGGSAVLAKPEGAKFFEVLVNTAAE